ncbi:unnamed protein product [Vicia faba]|uniref:Uncharacterized protein n=1 Tax=Vicia faba TaxID=3906 RepID=A0AAV1B403_VICFA|nr:unnamed protein product [Vicia faba]
MFSFYTFLMEEKGRTLGGFLFWICYKTSHGSRLTGFQIWTVNIKVVDVISCCNNNVVGVNKPLQGLNSRTILKDDGVIILIRFESLNGSLVSSGIDVTQQFVLYNILLNNSTNDK